MSDYSESTELGLFQQNQGEADIHGRASPIGNDANDPKQASRRAGTFERYEVGPFRVGRGGHWLRFLCEVRATIDNSENGGLYFSAAPHGLSLRHSRKDLLRCIQMASDIFAKIGDIQG